MPQISPYATQVEWIYANIPWREMVQLSIEDDFFTGRTARILNQEVLNFSNAGYLGLHADERLKVGAMEAIGRFGVQFSSSRSYLSLPLYEELEDLLAQIFGRPTLVAPSTTLAHMSVMPLLFTSGDAAIIDQKAHASLQTMIQIAKAGGTHLEMMRHNSMSDLETRLERLAPLHERIWFVTDGIFSMYGDLSPFDELRNLLDRFPQLHIYMDDAHGMSWFGQNGRGMALEKMGHHDRLLIVTSLNKGFSAGGGAIILPNEDMKNLILRAGPGLVFSGPLQPAALGAAIESAKIHLSPEIRTRQRKLHQLIKHFINLSRELQLPLADEGFSPVFYLAVGKINPVSRLVIRLREAGFFTNPALFPAVPVKNSGVRISLTWHHELQDITRLLHEIRGIMPEILESENWSMNAARRSFNLPQISEPVPEWQEV